MTKHERKNKKTLGVLKMVSGAIILGSAAIASEMAASRIFEGLLDIIESNKSDSSDK